jgi:hypothetical protein
VAAGSHSAGLQLSPAGRAHGVGFAKQVIGSESQLPSLSDASLTQINFCIMSPHPYEGRHPHRNTHVNDADQTLVAERGEGV